MRRSNSVFLFRILSEIDSTARSFLTYSTSQSESNRLINLCLFLLQFEYSSPPQSYSWNLVNDELSSSSPKVTGSSISKLHWLKDTRSVQFDAIGYDNVYLPIEIVNFLNWLAFILKPYSRNVSISILSSHDHIHSK